MDVTGVVKRIQRNEKWAVNFIEQKDRKYLSDEQSCVGDTGKFRRKMFRGASGRYFEVLDNFGSLESSGPLAGKKGGTISYGGG